MSEKFIVRKNRLPVKLIVENLAFCVKMTGMFLSQKLKSRYYLVSAIRFGTAADMNFFFFRSLFHSNLVSPIVVSGVAASPNMAVLGHVG